MELLPLVCLCLLSCSGDAVRVVVEQDSDAVLPCLISTKENITGKLFDWKKDGQKEVFMYDAGIHYNNGRTGQDEQFKGRVSHFQDQLKNGNASIKITRTKMADSGNYSCDFPRHQPSQPFIIELVVGAAPRPYIDTLAETNHWSLLQCEAHGVPRPTLKWEDSDNNTLPAEEPHISERGGRSYITVKITVTKTDNYSCVATQETLSHQVATVTSVVLTGSNTGWIAFIVVSLLLVVVSIVAVVAIVLYLKNRNKQHCKKVEKKIDGENPDPADKTTELLTGSTSDTTY
ncbi:V-set and immunoglobulin domain-containing protein 1-like [Sparus aurata]|uniref:V-set and immunoglobulin domain-containing protein 1-like n=1 Tax=Sparus aurata TaxID=8175 RepID=UPI0011C107A0|nr:V-set and immunoglobulin domain-containing protein 1-like [Sparus aurata]